MRSEAIIALCRSSSSITDIIGSNPIRLYPGVLPQGLTAFPAVAFRKVSIIPNPSFDGASRMDFNHVDFHFYADTELEARDLADAFRTLEDTEGIFAGTEVANVRFIGSSDDYLSQTKKYTISEEYRISTKR